MSEEKLEQENSKIEVSVEIETDHNKIEYKRVGQNPKPKRQLVGVDDKKAESKRLLIFLAIAFGITWIMQIFVVRPMYLSGDEASIAQAVELLSQLTFAPAFAAVIARLFTQEGLSHSGLQFNVSENRFFFLFGWFGSTVLAFAGAVLYFIFNKANFDPNMTNFVNSYTGAEEDAIQIVAAFKTDLLIKVFTAPALDIINSFGEEWGFRAYLLPKLYRKFGTMKAILLTSFLSGLWYAPLVALGYFYGNDYTGFPVSGIVAMCIFGMATGIIYSSLSLITGSVFPAVFAHSAMNVMMTQAVFFTVDGGNPFIGPGATGMIGGLPVLLTAVGFLVYIYKHPVKTTAQKEEEKAAKMANGDV